MRLASSRLVQQLQRLTDSYAYGDHGYFTKYVGTGVYDENNTETMTLLKFPVDCSFTEKPAMEMWRDYADIGQVDAEVRFTGYNPSKGDKFRIETRFDGQSHSNTADNFEVSGVSNRYAFGYVVALRKVAV